MQEEEKKSFWRRKGLKLPGSVRIVPRDQAAASAQGMQQQEPLVIGARYAYTSLVANRPHQAASTTVKSSPSTKATPSSTSAVSHAPVSKHKHTGSTPKSFNAFMEDTNDEWDDKIDEQSEYLKAMTLAANDVAPKEPAKHQTDTETPPQITNNASSQDTTTTATATQTSPQVAPSPRTIQAKRKPVDANGVIENIDDVLKDPSFTLCRIQAEDMPDSSRIKKFTEVLSSANVDLAALRALGWNGIPMDLRLMAWQLLLGYLPCNSERRVGTLARKRKEYSDSIKASHARGPAGLDQALAHQIHIDILRTNPNVFLYQSTITQECLERILYQWAIRHPASGYVQGINDLVTPIFEVFLSAYIGGDPEQYDVSKLNQQVLDVIEADSFWCLSKLLDGIQDNYTFAQPGIQRQIVTLKDLVSRIDGQLALHLEQEGVEFIQFAFRWMNCLLMRELPLKTTIRMWDTYLAEGSSEGFSEFHIYVCAAFLVKWSGQLRKMDFQEIMIFLQQLPTSDWQEKDVEILLSEAYMWKSLFQHAPSHLKSK
ncbi:rab-GTPase-TBC domain-containing protein [Gongronella butleri]|nr:rab-GTPase-TBC domain-containing protein [Gongronella butleri]